jgi:Protein of unknown function (DUF3617)
LLWLPAQENPMPFSIRCVALVLALGVVSPWAGAQALNVRPGGWDMTISVAMGGGAAKVTPLKTCVTKEELEGDHAFQKDESCTHKINARTATRVVGTMSCKTSAGQGQGTIEIVAKTPDTVLMTTTMKGSGPQGSIDVRTEVKGRWASASCKGYND